MADRLPMPRSVPVLAGKTVTLRLIDPQRDTAGSYEWNLDPEMHVWTGNDVLMSLGEAQAELERSTKIDDLTISAIGWGA